ncbi:hypothetical protein ACFL96_14285 [Thermoproteota archaeon]
MPLAAIAGFFKPENAFSIAVLFMAGPAAILTAVLLDGTVKQRMLAAVLAGVIATTIVVLAAGLGPQLLEFMNITVLKIVGGVAVMAIALLIMGVKIPNHLPTAIMVLGVILSFILRNPL